MARESKNYCPLTDEQLATPQARDENGVSAYCRRAITQYCFLDCPHIITLVPREGFHIEIVPDDDMEIRGNPNTNYLGC